MKNDHNKKLNEKFNDCTNTYDSFIESTHNIVLEEKRTAQTLSICRAKTVKIRHALNMFEKELKHQAKMYTSPSY